MENIIVREYIESLNESGELDYIFPLLLEGMGFRIITTPANSKGQSQYGKDIVAVRKDDGELFKYYFELKGFYDQNIDDRTFYKKDGFRDSILAAKDTAFNDSSIPRFNHLPTKIIYIHNGVLIENTRNTFDGFVNNNFNEGEFERWDLYKLTELFSQYLFSEYILTDKDSVRLFKRVLVLLDAPDYDLVDFKALVAKQFERTKKINNKREISNLFASLRLINVVILRYSKDNENITPSKKCINYTLLQAWHWILSKELINNKRVLDGYNRLVILYTQIYHNYLTKTLGFAAQYKGLYSYGISAGEEVCYPLRCFDYINDLLVFYSISNVYLGDKQFIEQKKQLMQVIQNNQGCYSPLIDIHSNTIKLVVAFILHNTPTEEDWIFVREYIAKIASNVILRYRRKKELPELNNNENEVARSFYKKREEYNDKSSLFLLCLFEFVAYFELDELYDSMKKIVEDSDVDLQVVYPRENVDVELSLFSGNINESVCVETSILLTETAGEFRDQFRKRYDGHIYATDKSNYSFMRTFAHIYNRIEFFPDFLNLGYCEQLTDKNLEKCKKSPNIKVLQ